MQASLQRRFTSVNRAPRLALRRTKIHAAQVDAPSQPTDTGNSVKHRKLELLSSVAGLDRGMIASPYQQSEVAVAIKNLEDAGYQQLQAMDSTAMESALQGKWQLLYTTAEVFRSSPFFWAFQEGLVGNQEIAGYIFKFTDSIPGAKKGQAYQTFDFPAGQLVSEVDLEVFPGAKGCVVTTSTVAVSYPPTTLSVTVDNTRVSGSNLLPGIIDAVAVPVKTIIEGIKGPGSTTVTAEITYIDEDMRIVRTSDGKMFVYRRASTF